MDTKTPAPDPRSGALFNPMLPWIDLGLRALDISFASSQAVSDGVDRAARAQAARTEWQPLIDTLPRDTGWNAASRWHAATFDFMTLRWEQWMASMGAVMQAGAGGMPVARLPLAAPATDAQPRRPGRSPSKRAKR